MFRRECLLLVATSFEIYSVGSTYRREGLRKKPGFDLLRTTEEVLSLETEFFGFASIVENTESDIKSCSSTMATVISELVNAY